MREQRVGGTARSPRIILTTFALIAAPVLGAMACMTLMLIYGLFTTTRASIEGIPQVIAAAGLFGGYYGAIPSVLIGWPVHLLIQRLKLVRMYAYAVGGLLIGIICLGIMWLVFGGSGYIPLGLHTMFAAAGAFGGLIFWLIRRPDWDASNSQPAGETGT